MSEVGDALLPRNINLLKPPHLLRAEPNLQRRHRLINMPNPCRSNDRRRNISLLQHPSQRDLRRAHSPRCGNLRDAIHDCLIRRTAIQLVGIVICLRAFRARRILPARPPAQKSPSHRAVRNQPNPLRPAERQQLALILTPEQIVMVLHGCELRQPMSLGMEIRSGELPERHVGDADVQHLAGRTR